MRLSRSWFSIGQPSGWMQVVLGVAAALVISSITLFYYNAVSLGSTFLLSGSGLALCALIRHRSTIIRRLATCPRISHLFAFMGEYPADTVIAGIQWQTRFVDVRLELTNDGPAAIERLDLVLELDTHIAAIAQWTNIPNVVFSPPNIPLAWLGGVDEAGRPITLPIVPAGPIISPAHRVYCERLQPDSALSMVIASAAMNPTVGGALPQQMFAPRRALTAARIRGTYEIDGNPRSFEACERIMTQVDQTVPTSAPSPPPPSPA